MYRVLLVEDDMALRFIYKKMKTWTECGFAVSSEASNGKQALDILEKESFDLIFTDIRMPFIDGIELLKKLSEQGNTTPVVFASSYNEFEYARQGLVLGAFDYLLKPVEQEKLEELLNRVKKHIEENQKEEKIASSVETVLNDLNISRDDKFVDQIALYCSAHCGEVLSADDFASSQGYSKDYFGKVFKQHFNMNFREFYSRIKIAYAIELLDSGNYKTYEVSDILGYSSVDYFTKIFKEITGVTPSKYRS